MLSHTTWPVERGHPQTTGQPCLLLINCQSLKFRKTPWVCPIIYVCLLGEVLLSNIIIQACLDGPLLLTWAGQSPLTFPGATAQIKDKMTGNNPFTLLSTTACSQCQWNLILLPTHPHTHPPSKMGLEIRTDWGWLSGILTMYQEITIYVYQWINTHPIYPGQWVKYINPILSLSR